jgi:putative transposase
MKKSRFSESQIIRILKEADGGRKVADICREHGVSQAAYYQWKAKFGGIYRKDFKYNLNCLKYWDSYGKRMTQLTDRMNCFDSINAWKVVSPLSKQISCTTSYGWQGAVRIGATPFQKLGYL